MRGENYNTTFYRVGSNQFKLRVGPLHDPRYTILLFPLILLIAFGLRYLTLQMVHPKATLKTVETRSVSINPCQENNKEDNLARK